MGGFCKFTDNLPYMSFLHGCAVLGYNDELGRSGPIGYCADEARKQEFTPTQLLYPIGEKNYNSDSFIKEEWERTTAWVRDENTKIFTVFGYGAPETDIEAIQLLSDSWGPIDDRNMEQVEMINIEPEEQCTAKWEKFIHSHHYNYYTDFFDSRLSNFPRRTFENYNHQMLPMTPAEAFQQPNPVPKDFKSLEEMWKWFTPLIEAEDKVQSED